MRALALVLVAGCGRLDFDLHHDAAVGQQDDAAIDSPSDAPWQTPKTFGGTTFGGLVGMQTADAARFASYQLPDEALVTSIVLSLVGNGAGMQPMVGVIYSDNAGEPGMLVARSVEVMYPGTATAQTWADFALDPPVRLHPGTYWIGDHTGAPVVTSFTYDSQVGAGRRPVDVYSDGTDQTAGPSTSPDRQYAFYARYLTAP